LFALVFLNMYFSVFASFQRELSILNLIVVATEDTDHEIRNEQMTIIWAHGQVHQHIEYFYPPDEIKYHGDHKGKISLNFFGLYTCANEY